MPRNTRSVPPPGGAYRLGPYEVARIGYGAMQLRHCASNPAEAVVLLERAIDLGVDHIDTAQFYGDGFVNEMIRKVLRPGDGVVVASKIGADPDPQGRIPLKLAQHPKQLRASVEDNLVSLGLERIPVLPCEQDRLGAFLPPRRRRARLAESHWPAEGDRRCRADEHHADAGRTGLAAETRSEHVAHTRNGKHLEQNLAAASVVLDEDAMADLDTLEPATTDHQP